MRRLLLAAILMVSLDLPVFAQQKPDRYRVSFPHIDLKTNRLERIESVAVVMHCGRFVALNSIPDDWSAAVVSPVSERTTLKMQAGHGSSELSHSEELNGFVTVLAFDHCFDVRASITAGYYDGKISHERKISFSPNQLIPNPDSQEPPPTVGTPARFTPSPSPSPSDT